MQWYRQWANRHPTEPADQNIKDQNRNYVTFYHATSQDTRNKDITSLNRVSTDAVSKRYTTMIKHNLCWHLVIMSSSCKEFLIDISYIICLEHLESRKGEGRVREFAVCQEVPFNLLHCPFRPLTGVWLSATAYSYLFMDAWQGRASPSGTGPHTPVPTGLLLVIYNMLSKGLCEWLKGLINQTMVQNCVILVLVLSHQIVVVLLVSSFFNNNALVSSGTSIRSKS